MHIFDLKTKELHLPLSCKVVKARTFDDNKAVEFTTDNKGVTLRFDEAPSGIDYIVELITK